MCGPFFSAMPFPARGLHTLSHVRYTPQKVNRPEDTERMGRASHLPHAHMQNFLDAIRGHAEPNCPFEVGWRVTVACSMAVESYRTSRTVRWNTDTEEIV